MNNNYFYKQIYLLIICTIFNLIIYAQVITEQSHYHLIRRSQVYDNLNEKISFNFRSIFKNQDSITPISSDIFFGRRINFKRNNFNSIELTILPINTSFVFNSHHPTNINDGEFLPSKGIQKNISHGIHIKRGNWSTQIRPSLLISENKPFQTFLTQYDGIHWRDYYEWVNRIDLPERFRDGKIISAYLNQSYMKYNYKNASIRLSTENLWWGPGMYQSLLMTNNSPGFLHLNFQSDKPISTKWGNIEWQTISGKLLNSKIEPVESRRVFNGQFLYNPKIEDQRIITGGLISFQPKHIPGLFIGYTKIAYLYKKDAKSVIDFLPLFGTFGLDLTKSEKLDRKKTMGSIFFRYLMQKEKAEIYAEIGNKNKTINPTKILSTENQFNGYVAGLRKFLLLRNKQNIEIGLEFFQVGLQNSNDISNIKSWYLDESIRHGFTNRGQIVGSGLGPGSNSQLIETAWNSQIHRIALTFERRIHNNDFYYYTFRPTKDFRRHWVDLLTSIQFQAKLKNMFINIGISGVRTLNYHWWYVDRDLNLNHLNYFKNGLDVFNILAQCSINYLIKK